MSAPGCDCGEEEEWLPIPGHPGYEASSCGRIRSPRKVLSPHVQAKGYLRLNLGRGRQEYVHTLVMEAWVGARPPGQEVDHLDWNRTNNHPWNLRWLPKVTNCQRWFNHRFPTEEAYNAANGIRETVPA